MRVYIIRHGETAWNTQLRLQGQTDIPLNDRGRSLAERTARGLREIPFDLVITSPLVRAKETAQIIVGDRGIPILEDERIQEIHFGALEGVRLTGEQRNTPGNEFYNFFHAPEQYRPEKGGESLDEFCARTSAFLDDLAGNVPDSVLWAAITQAVPADKLITSRDLTILISTHGAASRALLAAIRKTPRAAFWEHGVPENCAVTEAELENGRWIVRAQDVVYDK